MGQLTNLYVSESYQGLLKLADSTTGVTSTLQYVQDGLGGNTALQISKTQVNITGSLTVNGSPVAATDTGSLMKTGSVAGSTLTFTKGDGSQFSLAVTSSAPSGTVSGSQQIIDLGFLQTSSFNSYTSSNDSKVNSLIASTGSYATTSSLTSLSQSIATTDLGQNNRLDSIEGKTGSYATTGSNNFVGQQNINGSVNVTGSLNVTGTVTATSASFTYVNTIYETASVIYSSGSNQFGDASNDTQTLWGTVNLPSGPLVVTGSVTATSFTGSLQGTASYALNSLSSSYATNADTASIARDVIVVGKCDNAGGLTRGTVVRITGANGDNPLFDSASWSDEQSSANVLGMLSEDVAFNGFANVVVLGKVLGLNTNAYTPSTLLYLSSSGQYTSTVPTAPSQSVRLGQVLRQNTNQGSIYFRADNGYELGELHNVVDTANTTGELLAFTSGSYGLWKNQTIGNLGIATTSSLNSATGSLLKTGSVAGNVLTFTKGDGTTFNLTVDTGSAASINTGSFATTGSNIFRGSQVISGSLIGNSLNNGMIFINSEAYESGSVKANISASAAISQSNIFFGGTTGPASAGFTGSIVVTGSNNIFMGGPRPSTIAQGTYGYSNGNLNIQSGQQTLTTSSVFRPNTNNNINMATLAMSFTSGALQQPTLNNNIIEGTVAITHNSGSITYNNNINVGTVTSNANNITLPFLTTIQQNIFGASTNTINHISSSVTMTNNLTAGASLTITNLVSSSASPTVNGLSFNNNIAAGSVGIWVSGSNPTNRRTVIGNLLGGGNTSVTASAVGSEFSSLQNSIVWGQNLIISGTHPANANGGTAFFGRFNDATTLHTSNEIVFAVGTGTGTGTRRTGLYITSGSLVGVSGSLDVKGDSIFTGSLTSTVGFTGSLQGTASFATQATSASFAPSDRNGVITTGSLAGTQSILGTIRISGSSPLQVGTENNVGKINTYGGANWLYRNGSNYNTVIGNVAGVDNGFFGSSEKNMILNGFFTPFSTGSNNVIIQGAGDDFISGSNNIFIGSHTNHAGGIGSVLIGSTSYPSGSIFDSKFELGTQASSRIFHKQGADPLQIGDDTQVTGSLLVSNGLTASGSAVVTGSVQGNVTSLTISSNTASLNLDLGNFYTLQLVSGSACHINPSNIKPGQTVNIRINTTGSATVNFPTSVKQVSGSSYVPTTSTGVDIITLVSFDGSDLYLANVKNLI